MHCHSAPMASNAASASQILFINTPFSFAITRTQAPSALEHLHFEDHILIFLPRLVIDLRWQLRNKGTSSRDRPDLLTQKSEPESAHHDTRTPVQDSYLTLLRLQAKQGPQRKAARLSFTTAPAKNSAIQANTTGRLLCWFQPHTPHTSLLPPPTFTRALTRQPKSSARLYPVQFCETTSAERQALGEEDPTSVAALPP